MAISKITTKGIADDAVTSAKLAAGAVTINDIPDGEITADKLHTTLDLSTKTLTLTQASVTAHQGALSVTQSQISDLSTTSDLAEGTNLYYTDVRADARAQLKIDALVGSAPGTLDTLQELGDALGDDPNFATTVTNSIAAKLPLAGGTVTGALTVNAALVTNVTSGRAGFFATDNPGGNTNNHIALFRDNQTQDGSGDGLGTIGITSAPGQDVYFGKRFKDSDDNTFAVMQNSSGAEFFTLNLSSGNLGLGTDAPAHKLHVKTTANVLAEPLALFENDYGSGGDVSIRLEGGASGNPDEIYIEFSDRDDANNSFTIGLDDDASKLQFGYGTLGTTNGHTQMTLQSDGKVGIGTISPAAKLEISSLYGTTLRLASTRNSNVWTVGDSIGRVEMYSADGTAPTPSVRSSIDAIVENTAGNSVGLAFKTYNDTERMRISSSGDVGIGTTAPAAKLHVNGSSAFGGPKWGTWTESMQTVEAGQQTVRIIEDHTGRWIVVGRWDGNASTSIQNTWSSVSGLSTSLDQNNQTAFSSDFGSTYPTECRFLGSTDWSNYYNTRTIDFIHGIPAGRPWELFMSNGATTGMGQVTGSLGGAKYGWTARGAYDGFGRWSNPNYLYHKMGDVGVAITHSSNAFRTPTSNAFNWNGMDDAKVTVNGTGLDYSGQDVSATSGFGRDDANVSFYDEYPNLISNFTGAITTVYSSAVWVLIKMGGI